MADSRHQNEPIAIIGSACRFPGPASSTSKLWEFLESPFDVSREIPSSRFNVDSFYYPEGSHHGTSNTKKSYFMEGDHRLFDTAFFQIHPREAETMDPQQRMLLETVYEALESAGLTIEGMQGSETSVFVGGMSYDFRDATAIRDPASTPEYSATGTHASILAARISYFFDWKGPCMSIDTACSSSLVAVHQAVQTLRSGDASVAVAAGSNLILGPEQYVALSNLQMLSPSGKVRMWDSKADGYARGEGFGAVMLKTLSQALKNGDEIECIIRETGIGQDGKTIGITMPSPSAQTSLIRKTYQRARLDLGKASDRPQYFEAHGTGTPAGDPIEAKAIYDSFFDDFQTASEFGTEPLYVGSIKTVIGHLEGAAGIAGLLKASLAVQHGVIPPNLHFDSLNPKINQFYGPVEIPTTRKPWPKTTSGNARRASVNSFGFGGTNAHVIVESYEGASETRSHLRNRHGQITPLTISAKSERSLVARIQSSADYIAKSQEVHIEDLAYTLQSRQTHFSFRRAFSSASRSELLATMNECVQNSSKVPIGFRSQVSSSRLLGVFTGQGAQYAMMGKEILENSAAGRDIIASLDYSLATSPDPPTWTIHQELLASASTSRLSEAALSQPLCTAIQIMLVDLLRLAGVIFSTVVGHSSGEIAAAYAANYISASDAIRIAYYRGLHAKLACGKEGCSGTMMAVGLSFEAATSFCSKEAFSRRISVAASNSPTSCTLSGDSDAIDEAKSDLEEQNTFARRLLVDTAYHSYHMKPCTEEYLNSLAKCEIKVSCKGGDRCQWISSVHESGHVAGLDGLYWIDNMTRPVLFAQAAARAMDYCGPFEAMLEVGPHPALKGPVLETLRGTTKEDGKAGKAPTISYHGTLERKKDSVDALSSSLGFLWEHRCLAGINFSSYRRAWHGSSNQEPRLLKNIPSYKWDHQQIYQRESRLSNRYRTRETAHNDLLGTREPSDSDHEMRWRNLLSLKEIPWLKGHGLQGEIVVPAMWYVVMVLEGAKTLSSLDTIKSIEITDFEIIKAITLQEGSINETIFTLRRSSHDAGGNTIAADLSCASGPLFGSSSLDQVFTGKLLIQLSDTDVEFAPSISLKDIDTSPINAENFYAHLKATGYNYSGIFSTLDTIKKDGYYATATTQRTKCSYLAHPAILDLGLQAILAAYHTLEDGYPSPFLIPRSISRILVNTASCQRFIAHYSKITYNSVITDHSHAGISGDIEIIGDEGELEFQFEGVSWIPLTNLEASSDRKMFSKTVWKPDILSSSLVGVAEYSDQEQHLVAACDRAAWFYYRTLKESVTRDELDASEWHHQRLFAYIDHLLPLFEAGKIPTINPEWSHDAYEEILSLISQHPDSADLQLIQAVGENLPLAVKEKRTMLEFMMEGDKLNRYYQLGLGYQKAYSNLGTMVERISHRYPRMKVLEVGAGTGGATSHALKALNRNFHSYTFTDVSSGFFEKARQRFSEIAKKMLFKTFDLERDPLEQGYEANSYDLVIGSLVVHATKSLSSTLSYARSLLKPGGYLVLVEGSEDTLRSGFMMSGLPGWWVGGEDRKWGPMISPENWEVLLKDTGFSGIDTLVRDSNLPFVNLGEVIVSQAVDEFVDTLRSPLDCYRHLPTSHTTIVGGASHDIDVLCQEISDKIVIDHPGVKSLDSPELADIPSGSSVLCLSELDTPAFKNLTEATHQGLQTIFAKAIHIIFVTRSDGPFAPYSNILLGLVRTLRLEVPHLRIQTLQVEGPSLDAKVISESFLRLVHLSNNTSQGFLWSLEPQIEYSKGVLSIPRIIYDTPLNNRLNSERRLIKSDTDPTTTPIEVAREKSSYSLRTSKISNASDKEAVLVTHSTLHKILVGTSMLYACLGTLVRTKENVVTLSKRNASIIAVSPGEWCKVDDIKTGKECDFITLLSYLAMGRALLAQGPVLVHDSHLVLRNILDRESSLPDPPIPVLFSYSSRIEAQAKSSIHINSSMTRRQIKLALANGRPKTFVDFSKQSLKNFIDGCFPGTSYVAPFSTESQEQLNIAPTKVFPDSFSDLCDKAMSLVDDTSDKISISEVLFPIDACLSPTNSTELRIIDWTIEKSLPAQVRTVTNSFPLLSKNKTYLLVGLTGTMGKSLCEWMIEQGATHVILTSRNPQHDQSWLDKVTHKGATVKMFPLDITCRESLIILQQQMCRDFPSIGGVVNGAMVLRDGSYQAMSFEAMSAVLCPKVDGSRYLDELFLDPSLEFFIMFSSIAWVVGNPGQSSYAAANGFMTALAADRRRRGLAASTMSIGVVAGVGYLARTKEGKEREHARGRNVMTISEDELKTIFAEAIIAGKPESAHGSEIIAGLDGNIDTSVTPKESLSAWLSDPRVSQLIIDKNDELSQQSTAMAVEIVPLKQQLSSATSPSNAIVAIISSFSTKMERMLQLEPGSILDTSPLVDTGVDSLLAVEIRSWFLIELKIDVPILKILSGASIAEISSMVLSKFQEANDEAQAKSTRTLEVTTQVNDSASSTGAIDTPPTEDEGPPVIYREKMSFTQARMWRVSKHTSGVARVNNLSCAYRIEGVMDIPRFEKSFYATIKNYESLRTRFFEEDGSPFQELLLESTVQLQLKEVGSEEHVDEEWERINIYAYNLPSGISMQSSFLTMPGNIHTFICGFHHIVIDTRSIEIFLSDLSNAYQNKLPEPHHNQLTAYANTEHKALATSSWYESRLFWKTQHEGNSTILPLFPFALQPSRQEMKQYALHATRHDLTPSLATSIQTLCQSLKVSPYHLHTGVLQILLHRLLNLTDLCIGSVDANRTEHQYRDVFGPFFNYLPIRFAVDPDMTFQELVLRTRGACYTAQGHAQYPFDAILDDLHIAHMPATHHPLYQAQINYLRHTIEEVPFGPPNENLVLKERNASGVDVSYDFCVSVLETGGRQGGGWGKEEKGGRVLFHVQEDLYGREGLEWLAWTYMRLLEELVKRPDLRVKEVDLEVVPGG
ncbi:reducing type I polyketide synthase 11 [Amylocarpus encephaloides]|uniref:Reducing type I polyketide synthase 11 n=1 Tax=Amylocarpus encephaloides TaxID=45428 RepID=A0A9P7YPV3_9HELO|nr:reducing type I polyketide synthase 11 [Amylocarpus encephaloides]